jgi:hypothetical protein
MSTNTKENEVVSEDTKPKTSVEMVQNQKTSTVSEEKVNAETSDNHLLELARGILSDIQPELADKIGSEGIMEILKKLKLTPENNTKKLELDVKTASDVSVCKDLPLPLTPEDLSNTPFNSFNTTVGSDNSVYFSPCPEFELGATGLTVKSNKDESVKQTQDKESSPESVYGTPHELSLIKTPLRPMTPRSMIPIRKTPITSRPKSSLGDPLETSSTATPKSTTAKKSVIENLMTATSQFKQ